MDIDQLKKKISTGDWDYEVEDILNVASYPSPLIASELVKLSIDCDWKRGVSAPHIPLGDWADVVIQYCNNGILGLEQMATNDDRTTFVLSFLSHLQSIAALNATEKILLNNIKRFHQNETDGNKIVSTLNSLAMSQKTKLFTSENSKDVRSFIHEFLHTPKPDHVVGTVFCALRFYGDRSSLEIINKYPPLPEHWEPARKSAVSFIKKRLSKNTP